MRDIVAKSLCGGAHYVLEILGACIHRLRDSYPIYRHQGPYLV